MASYTDLYPIINDAATLQKLEVAVCIAAQKLVTTGTPDAKARKWAKSVFFDPKVEAAKAWRFIIADNNGQDVSTITGATDAQIQAQVDAVAPILAAAMSNE